MGVCDAGRTAVGDAGLARWARRNRLRVALGFAASVLGATVAGPSWLSVSASASTVEPSPSESAEPSSPPESSGPSSTASPSSGDPSCATSAGVVTLPDPLPSGWSLPSWASSGDGPRCAVLDVSSLREQPSPVQPEQEPSTSQELTETQDALLAEVKAWRSLYVFSVGLLICLTAAIFLRTRTGRG